MGVSASMIGQWENDLRNPKRETLKRIAKALGVHILAFTDWDSIPHPEPGEEEDPSIMEEILKDYPYQTELGDLSGEDIDKIVLHQIKKQFSSDDEFYESFISGDMGIALQENKLDRRLISAYIKLNKSGQSKVADYAEDILPRYRAETTPQSPPAPQEGESTTPPSDAPTAPPERE